MLLKKAWMTSQTRIPSAHKSTSSEPSGNTVWAKENRVLCVGWVFFFLNNVKSKQKVSNYAAKIRESELKIKSNLEEKRWYKNIVLNQCYFDVGFKSKEMLSPRRHKSYKKTSQYGNCIRYSCAGTWFTQMQRGKCRGFNSSSSTYT